MTRPFFPPLFWFLMLGAVSLGAIPARQKSKTYTMEDLKRLRQKNPPVSVVGTVRAPITRPETAQPTQKPPAPTAKKQPLRSEERAKIQLEISQKQRELLRFRKELQRYEQQMNPSMALYMATNYANFIREKREIEAKIAKIEKEIKELREKLKRPPAGNKPQH